MYANNTLFIAAIVIISCSILIWSNLILKMLILNYLPFIWLNDIVHLHPLLFAIPLPLLFSVVLLLFIVQLIFFGMKTFWNVFGCDLFAILSGAAGVSSLTTCHVFLFIFISVISCHSNDNRSLVNHKWFCFHLELSFLRRTNVLPFLNSSSFVIPLSTTSWQQNRIE